MVISILPAALATDNTQNPFTDVDEGAWYYKYVQGAYEQGLMVGTSATTFSPNTTLSRAMVAQILYNKEGKPQFSADAGFTDVSRDAWYYDAVQWAAKNKVAVGVGDSKFAPDADVTREQFATMLYNYAGKPNVSGELTSFPDSNSVSGWAKSAMFWVVSQSIVSGSKQSDGTLLLMPQSGATRAEAATMIYRYVQVLNQNIKKFTVTFDSNGGSQIESQTVIKGETVTKPNDPTKDGYTFDGWYTDETLENAYDFSEAVTGDITLYAKWNEHKEDGDTSDIDTSDNDNDQVEAWVEELFGSSSELADSDHDGLSDYIEIYFSCTDPTKVDSDGNGIADKNEDFDGDGLTNIQEVELGTIINKEDSDTDGLTDYEEVHVYNTDPLNEDTDHDGLLDGDEVLLGLDPNLVKSDGVTSDAERRFKQTLSSENISEELLDSDNSAIPSLEANVAGVIDRTVLIEKSSSSDFGDSRALVGHPITVLGDTLDQGTLSFSLLSDSISTISVASSADSNMDVTTKLICKYNDDGSTELFETDYDEHANTISANIKEKGIYFVMDVQALFDELGLSLPTVASLELLEDSSAMVMSIDDPEDEESNNQNNTDASSVSASSKMRAGKNLAVASADMEKVTLAADTSAKAQADIVFIIDTTGSMSGAINRVKDNVNAFVDALKDRGISAGLALVEYRDIEEDGENTTVVHKNGASNWFYDIRDYKNTISSLYADGGGDTPESAVDALETARLLDMRASAGKIFVLITDADYKTGNRYGIPSMEAEIELLKNAGVSCSVVSETGYETVYHNLYSDTKGIFANIDSNFNTDLIEIANNIGDEIVGDGCWIYLQGPVPVPVRLDAIPKAGSTVDTDHDGIPDVDELESATPTGVVDLDEIIRVISKGAITDTNYGKVNAYKYKSSPVTSDTDYDGMPDSTDKHPKSNSFTGRIESHDKDKLNYSQDKGKISFNVDYRNFFGDLQKYNSQIGVLSSLFAADIYTGTNIYVDELLSTRNLREELLETFGLSNPVVKKVGYEDNDRTEVSLGHHLVEYNGKKKEIVLVDIRGTNGTFAEWSSNFDVGADTSEYYALAGKQSEWNNKQNHKGFDVTANRVLNEVSNYVNNVANGVQKDTQILYWVTGHSRGAGIANLVGSYLEERGNQTVTYTFAAPTTTTSTKAYHTIFNIVNDDDLIPTLPLEKWKFKRYGTDKKVCVSKYSGDKTLWGTYKGGAFKELTDINYNNNEKVSWLLGIFEQIASSRDDLYHFTYADDTLQLYGTNYFNKADAEKKLKNVRSDLAGTDKEKQQLLTFGDYRVLEGTNGFGGTVYRVGCYQTPACFMQALADLAAGTSVHKVAGKYESARNAFVVTYFSGMAHPHWPETYYLIAKGAFSNAW